MPKREKQVLDVATPATDIINKLSGKDTDSKGTKSKDLEDLEEAQSGYQDGLDIELSELYVPNAKYTPEQKVQAAMAFVLTGTSVKAEKLVNIPAKTIRWWKAQAVWWPDLIRECRKYKQDELDARYTKLLDATVGELEDRVVHGNSVFNKDGQQEKLPLSGKELAVIMAIIFDKRQLLRGDVTSRTETVSQTEQLNTLGRKFEDMFNKVQKLRVIDDVKPVDVYEEAQRDTDGHN